MSKKTFLTTTALEQFWDTNAEDGLFLGEWCKLHDRKVQYEKLNFKTLEYIWKNEDEIDNGIEYCEKIYASVSKKLAEKLNNCHGLHKDYRYWDILLRPWLSIYIQILYDRYRHVKLAQETNENLYTYVLDEKNYQHVSTPSVFSKNIIYSDEYNLQLYSQIIKFLNIEHTCKKHETSLLDTRIVLKPNSKNSLLKSASKLLNKLFNKESVLVVNPYFKNNSLLKYIILSLRSNFLFVFDNLQYEIFIDEKVDLDLRQNIFSIHDQNSEFENILFNSFVHNFPIIYLEGYLKFKEIVKNLSIGRYNALYGSNSMYGNEVFKFYAADNIDDTRFLYAQHGGNYGIDKKHVLENIEINFAKIYFTFGWKGNKTRVLPQAKMYGDSADTTGNVNFIMTAMPRYFYRFVYQEDSSKMLPYIENAKKFCINFKNIDRLVVRLYMDDYEWKIKERLLESGVDITFNSKVNYYKQVMSARVNVFDHLHTGYLETLSMNKPTVVVITDGIYFFRESSRHDIQKLIDANIIFKDAVTAAEFIDKIYNDVNKWWLSLDVQSAREEFCYKYARTSDDWANEWKIEFEKVLNDK